MDPGPHMTDLLSRQDDHRSSDVWTRDGYTLQPMTARMHLRNIGACLPPDERVVDYIKLAGFYGIYRLGSNFQLDAALITALVERWRFESHTFHLAVGEASITLQDVAVLLGLRVDGPAVTGSAHYDWPTMVEYLLGERPSSADIKGSSLKFRWLREFLGRGYTEDADDATVQCHARAYILLLMGAVMFADTTGGSIQLLYLPLLADLHKASQYSWGSATLAFLYRQLCKAAHKNKYEITGPLILLQLWSWERSPIGRPECLFYPTDVTKVERRNAARRHKRRRGAATDLKPPPLGDHFINGVDALAMRWVGYAFSYDHAPKNLAYYRDALDRQRAEEFDWEPYTGDILAALNPICYDSRHLWRSSVPLICFDIVEIHRPERVLKQFGEVQLPPISCEYNKDLHDADRRGQHQTDWADFHSHYITLWDARATKIAHSYPSESVPPNHFQLYMTWYLSRTRKLISPPGRTSVAHYQPVAPNLYATGQYISDVTGRGRKTVDSATQMHTQQQYGDLMSNVSGYCQYVTSKGASLLSQLPFDPSYYHQPSSTSASYGTSFGQAGPSHSQPESQPDFTPHGHFTSQRHVDPSTENVDRNMPIIEEVDEDSE